MPAAGCHSTFYRRKPSIWVLCPGEGPGATSPSDSEGTGLCSLEGFGGLRTACMHACVRACEDTLLILPCLLSPSDLAALGAWSPGLLLTLAKWMLSPSMIHSLTSTTWSTCSSMIPPTASSTARSRLRTGSWSSTGRPSPSSRSEIPPTSSGVMLVPSTWWNPLASSPPWRRPGLI